MCWPWSINALYSHGLEQPNRQPRTNKSLFKTNLSMSQYKIDYLVKWLKLQRKYKKTDSV